jgi:transposase
LATDKEFTRILGWPGYRVYQHTIDDKAKTIKLWVRRKRGNRKMECSGCGAKFKDIYDIREREVRDLPWSGLTATVSVEIYRVKCPDCGVRNERVPQLPSKAPFAKRFEDVVGKACEGASAAHVARQFGLPESTVRAIDLRYLERWNAARRKPPLRQMGVDEIYLGRKGKFISVVTNLETREPLWFGDDRRKETLDQFFREELSAGQRSRVRAACVDMWEPYRLSIEEWARNCQIVYDKFHILQHANQAVDEVRRAEFFRQGKEQREIVKGKRWLLLSRWVNLSTDKKRQLNELFRLNRKMLKAYLSKESLEGLWNYLYEGAMANYLYRWMDQLKWQRLEPFLKLGDMLVKHLDGILNYCRTKVPMGVVEAVNGNIKSLLRRGRGYTNLRYLLLKAQRMAASKAEIVAEAKAA